MNLLFITISLIFDPIVGFVLESSSIRLRQSKQNPCPKGAPCPAGHIAESSSRRLLGSVWLDPSIWWSRTFTLEAPTSRHSFMPLNERSSSFIHCSFHSLTREHPSAKGQDPTHYINCVSDSLVSRGSRRRQSQVTYKALFETDMSCDITEIDCFIGALASLLDAAGNSDLHQTNKIPPPLREEWITPLSTPWISHETRFQSQIPKSASNPLVLTNNWITTVHLYGCFFRFILQRSYSKFPLGNVTTQFLTCLKWLLGSELQPGNKGGKFSSPLLPDSQSGTGTHFLEW